MFSVELFLGYPVEGGFAEALGRVDPQLANLFIQGGENYLQQVVHQDVRYLGKFAGEMCDIGRLELLEKNIFSLLKKLIPDYSYESVSLVLFPTNK